MTSCDKNDDNSESSYINFTRKLMSSFVLLVVISLVLGLKSRLLTEGATLFYVALFIIGATILLTIVGTVNSYVYSQLVLGIGMAVGLQLMDWRKAEF